MSEPSFHLADLGDRRVLTVDGRAHETRYSARVVRLLVERKGARRAPLYFPFKEERARLFLEPLFATCGNVARAILGPRGRRLLRPHDRVSGRAARDRGYPPSTRTPFVDIVRAKVEEQDLRTVKEVRLFGNDETRRLPWPDGRFDLVLVVGVVEHLPPRNRRAQVDEYYRVLASGGHIAILDTPNRLFPLETHSIGLPLVQWLPPRLAYAYARLARPRKFGAVSYESFVADGTGWRNATLADCLPSGGPKGLVDVTEAAGYGWRFFRDTAGIRPRRRALLRLLAGPAAALRLAGRSPSLCLPYFNLLFQKL